MTTLRAGATTRVGDIEICFDEFGPSDAPTVLLVAGLGAQSIVYDDEFCERIVARGHHVVRYDNRDIGLSTHLHDQTVDVLAAFGASAAGQPVDAPYTLVDMAADGIGLLDALEVARAHVFGSSMGGMIAQTMAIEHPDRVASLTSMMSTTGEPDVGNPDPEALGSLLAIMAPQATRAERIATGVELARIIGTPSAFDESYVRERTARFVDRSYDPDGVSRQLVAIVAAGSRADGLAALDVPAVVLHGDRDPLVDISGGFRTAELIPGAEMRVLEGAGHDMAPPYWDQLIGGLTTATVRATP